MGWLLRVSTRRPLSVLALLLLITVLASLGLRNLEVDPDVLRDLPDDLPAKQLYDRIGQTFPSKEMVFVGIAAPEGESLWTAHSVGELDTLTRAIEDLGVVQQVSSPTNATVVVGTAEGMEIRAAADPLPTDDAGARALRDFLLSQDALRGTVISDDGQVAALMVFLQANLGTTESKAAGQIQQAVQAHAGDLQLYPAGRPMVSYFSSKTVGKETGMLSSAALVLMAGLLFLMFFNLRGVLLPLGVVVAAVLWTMGGMGWLRVPMTHSTEALPIMLIAVGVADGVHIVQSYLGRLRHQPDKRAALDATMADLWRPVVMTSITSAAGFLALNTSGVRSIMVLGMLTAFGIMVALLFSLSFVPACLALLPVPRHLRQASQGRSRLQRLMIGWGELLYRHRPTATLAVLALVGLSIYGATRVQVETSVLENFPRDNPIYRASMFVNEHFAGVTSVQVVFEGDQPDEVKDPEFLAQIEAFQRHAEGIEGVGGTSSVVPILESMNQVLHGGDATYKRLPAQVETEQGFDYQLDESGEEVAVPTTRQVSGREILAGYFGLIEMSGKPGALANFVTDDYRSAKVTVFLKSDRKKDMDRIVHDLDTWLDDAQSTGVAQVDMTGMAVLMLAVNDLITRGQALSILVSLTLVFLITAIMFRSPVLGMFNVVPLFAALFFNFGVMGLFGLDINLMTMGVASMAIGVGVDFGIHFIHRYREAFQGDPHAALRTTMAESGVAILMNMVAVAGGFLTLLFATFQGVRTMGLLISLIMAFSAVGALTVLPLLFTGLRPRAIERKLGPLLLILAGVLATGTARAQDGRAFMEQVLERGAIHDMVGTATLTITSASGTEKVRVFKMASRQNDEGDTDLVMRMEQPADMRGNGFLLKGHAHGDDERYVYVPALRRVNRITGAGRGGSFMSSDFSYEDIGSPELDDWVWTLQGEDDVDGHACRVVLATPATPKVAKDTGYSKVIYLVDEQLQVSRGARFFDKRGVELKHLEVARIEQVGGVPFATDLRMVAAGSGRASRLVMEGLIVNQGVEPAWFTNRALQNGF